MEDFKIPKNIRQIGGIEDWIKVYVEDYVVTYIHRLEAKGKGQRQYGVLIGRKERQGSAVYLFLNGAMEMAEGDFDRKEAWEELDAAVSQRFPGREIWGWFLCEGENEDMPGESVELYFRRYFQKEYQVLFRKKALESDFYVLSLRGLEALKGYFIYYERNEEMQEYMILSGGHAPKEPKEDNVVGNYRKLMQEKKSGPRKEEGIKKRGTAWVQVASLACVFMLGIMAFYGRWDMQASTLPENNGNEEVTENAREAGVVVEELPADIYPTETPGETQSGDKAQLESKEAGEGETEPKSQEPDGEKTPETQEPDPGQTSSQESREAIAEESTEAVPADTRPATYTVQKGDTLLKISVYFYGNSSMVDSICELNDIEDPDHLFAGIELQLP